MSQHPWGASNVKSMDTIGNLVEDYTHVPNAVKKTQTIWRKIAWKKMRCANYRQNHLAYTRSCKAYKKEKEILQVKHKSNVSFLEARKIVGTYMHKNSYASVAQRANTINQDNKYRALMEKLIQLEQNDRPKF